MCLAIFPPQPPLPIHSSVPAACAFLEALFMRNFHCITTQCMTQFIRSGEVSIFTLYLFLSLPLLCALLSFKKSRPTHTHSHRGGERESQSCTHWLHVLSGCHSCNRPKSDRCSVLVAVSLTAVFSLSFIPSLNCITAQHLQTFNNNRAVQKHYHLLLFWTARMPLLKAATGS